MSELLKSNCFESVLRNQRKGELLNEMSEAIQKATQAVKEHMKPAVVILKITIAPADGNADAVSVVDDVDLKVPRPSRSSSLFFTTDDNRLVRDNPNQTEMKLEVAKPVALPSETSEAAPKASVG